MNMNVLAVDINGMNTYDFQRDGETEADLLRRANEYRQNDIDTWTRHSKNYPDNDTFKGYLEQAKNKEYRVMAWEEYQKGERDYYINKPMMEVTEDRYSEMLNVLPPRYWMTINGVEMFCMSEMLTGSYTSQYARIGGRYYTKIVDMLDRSTWINNYLK